MSEQKGIKARFVAAWNACENPELDSENPHFRNRYASLKSTLKAVREACGPQGIAYVQQLRCMETEEGIDFSRRELRSYVTDGEDVMELSTFPVECPPNPQSFGSNLTYAKRQQAQADWGITGEPDDDGEAAAQTPRQTPGRRPGDAGSAQADRRKRMLARCAELSAKCVENGVNAGATDGYMRAKFDVERMDELTEDQLSEFGKYLADMAEQSAEMKAKREEA